MSVPRRVLLARALQVVRRDNSQLQRDILKSLIKTMVQPITLEEVAEHRVASKVDLTRQRIAKLVKDFNSEANARIHARMHSRGGRFSPYYTSCNSDLL